MSVISGAVTSRAWQAALLHTSLLLRVRWRMLRTISSRLAVISGMAVLTAGLFLSASLGYFLRRVAEQGQENALSEFAINYLLALEKGELSEIGVIALGSAVAASLFSPLTGAANQPLVAEDDLSGLRPPRLHRYLDSLVTTAISTIGFLQLLTLTAVASLLTLGGGRVAGLVFTWAIWPVLILLSVAEGWWLEWMHRSHRTQVRRVVFVTLAAVIGVAILVDPNHGRTLFGLGVVFAHALLGVAAGDVAVTAVVAVVLALLVTVLVWAGSRLCLSALSRPAAPDTSAGARAHSWRISRRPRAALVQILALTLLRSPEVRRPIGTILVIGVPAVWLAGNQRETVTALVVVIPLAVALAWGVNSFGIIGPAMTWLTAQPRLGRWMLGAVITIQLGTVAAITVLCWGPPLLVGRDMGSDMAAVVAGFAVSTALMSRSATAKSVTRPYPTRSGSRGDVIVPPLAAINYTLRFAMWGGQVGVVVISISATRQIQGVIVAVVLAWVAFRYTQLLRHWRDRTVQSRVAATVATS